MSLPAKPKLLIKLIQSILQTIRISPKGEELGKEPSGFVRAEKKTPKIAAKFGFLIVNKIITFDMLIYRRCRLPIAVLFVNVHDLTRFLINIVPINFRFASVHKDERLHLFTRKIDGFLQKDLHLGNWKHLIWNLFYLQNGNKSNLTCSLHPFFHGNNLIVGLIDQGQFNGISFNVNKWLI